jgi:alpha-L-arabinofuranosidase
MEKTIQPTQNNETLTASVMISSQPLAGAIPARVFGNFMEHLGYSTDGGVLAHALANPVFERDVHLEERQVKELLRAGKLLVQFYRSGLDPNVFPQNWSPRVSATGFGVCALDDYRSEQVPFPWAPLGQDGSASASVGRLGGAVRLRGNPGGQPLQPGDLLALDSLASGVRQGIFLPFSRTRRCLKYDGHVWARIAGLDEHAQGQIEVGLRRRLGSANPATLAGECLALARFAIHGTSAAAGAWQKLEFQLQVEEGQISTGEPVDFFIRWLPENMGTDVQIDQAMLLPKDAIEGIFDPDVVRVVKEWQVPLLRWPGGNYVSYYHWRDGVGLMNRRPTRPNYAWGGLEYNFMGTVEFIHFCRLVGAEPHITVNTGTGTAEEAAAWVEFCNGSEDTPMGRLRAAQGEPEPFGVKLWEVGNEIYGSWQGGYHGGEENALRFGEFAQAMRQVDPSIELIATGNQFDIAQPGPGLDHTAADRIWNKRLFETATSDMNYLSLHCLPANDVFLDQVSDEEAYYSLMAQPDSWERVFIPDLMHMARQAAAPGQKPVRLAITEWGVLGPRGDRRPVVENYGEVPYAGVFLNMAMRNCDIVAINNATALLHGGCVRKAGGQVFYDPQYTVIQQYTHLAGGTPLRCTITSPTYDVTTAPDLGLPLKDVPYMDIAVVRVSDSEQVVCAVNRHLHAPIQLEIRFEGKIRIVDAEQLFLANPDVTARARLGDAPERFGLQREEGDSLFTLPPCSVSWIRYTTETAD